MPLIVTPPSVTIDALHSYLNGYTSRPRFRVTIKNLYGAGTLFYKIKYSFTSKDVYIPAQEGGSQPYAETTNSQVLYVEEVELENKQYVPITVQAYVQADAFYSDITVAELTENGRLSRYNIVTNFKKDACTLAYLKAFIGIPTESAIEYYTVWEQTQDGVHFTSVPNQTVTANTKNIRVLKDEFVDLELEAVTGESYKTIIGQKFKLLNSEEFSNQNEVVDRTDILQIPPTNNLPQPPDPLFTVDNTTYRFKLISVKEIVEGNPAFDPDYKVSGATVTPQYVQDLVFGSYIYTPVFAEEFEFPYSDFGNSVLGYKLYSKKTVYSYGHEKFKNNVFVSDAGSFITPLFNAADLDTQDDSLVTALLPWRDYIIAGTEKALYILTKQEVGYTIKTVSTAIGIPKEDRLTCKAILNGIIFKAGNKIYTLFPNMYSSDDTMLNIGDVSKPIENILIDNVPHAEHNSFALSTEKEYILFIPQVSENTFCYKYNYSTRVWTFQTYPCIIYDSEIFSVDDIRLFGYAYKDGVKQHGEYFYGKDLEEAYPEVEVPNIPYGDILFLSNPDNTIPEDLQSWGTNDDVSNILPVDFYLDSGQRTNNISFTKQFTETKFILATEDEKDSFPISLEVYIDGSLHPHKMDIATDAAFWRNSSNQNLTLGGVAQPDKASRTLRQAFFRYSGKGKSIRHIISGKSLYKFKLYEIFYRFKNLNVKQ